MKISQITIDTLLKVLAWIIFLGLCIQTGAVLFNFIYSAFRPVVAQNLYEGLDLTNLLEQDKFHYWATGSLIVGVLALKAYVFYLVIYALRIMDTGKPFSEPVAEAIRRISYFALCAGLLGMLAQSYISRIGKLGMDVGSAGTFWDDRKAMLLMAAIVFFIARIFQKGIELQTENELTV